MRDATTIVDLLPELRLGYLELDENCVITYANDTACLIMGAHRPDAARDVVGRHVGDLIGWELAVDIQERAVGERPDERECREVFLAGLAGSDVTGAWLRSPDGGTRWLLRQPAGSGTRLAQLFSGLPVVAYTSRPDRLWSCEYVTPALEDLLGYSAATWITSPGLWLERVHPADRERLLLARTEAVSAGTDLRVEYRLRDVDDQSIWIRDQARLETRDGRTVAIHGILLDVTNNRQSGVVLEELYEAQVREAEKLRELQEEHRLLLQVLAHDVRQPVAILSGIIETLKARVRDLDLACREQLLERAEHAVRRTTSLLQQVLDHDRLRAQDGLVRREWVGLQALVQDALREVETGDRSVSIEGDAYVWIDPMIIERAAANLLVNAAKHTPGTARVRVRIHTENAAFVLTVEDDGPGLPAGTEEQIFEPFVRMGTQDVAGMGLGLAFVRRLARMHDGDAWAERLPDGGSAFHLRIPQECAPERPGAQD